MSKLTPIPYGRQTVTDEDIQAVTEVLRSDFLTQGPKIAEFEEKFAAYVGAPYAVAVANGTAALHLALLGMGIGKGSRVITTPITFVATANAVLYAGGQVYFSDIDPQTFTLDLNRLENLLHRHPKGYFDAVIPVDLGGYPVPVDELAWLGEKYGFKILEDACHAPGAFITDRKGNRIKTGSGQYIDAAAFSFHPVKHIAAGEGGMITTTKKEIYEKAKRLRTHGITKENLQYKHFPPEETGGWYYEIPELGYNYRITDIHSALGISQLKRAEEGLKRRQAIADRYREALKDLPLQFQAEPENGRHAYHLFIIRTGKRKELYDYLRQNGIYAQVHYIPVHLLDIYSRFGWKKGDFPEAERYYAEALSLPMYPGLRDEQQEYVIHKVKEFFSEIVK